MKKLLLIFAITFGQIVGMHTPNNFRPFDFLTGKSVIGKRFVSMHNDTQSKQNIFVYLYEKEKVSEQKISFSIPVKTQVEFDITAKTSYFIVSNCELKNPPTIEELGKIKYDISYATFAAAPLINRGGSKSIGSIFHNPPHRLYDGSEQIIPLSFVLQIKYMLKDNNNNNNQTTGFSTTIPQLTITSPSDMPALEDIPAKGENR